ncbi:MAG: cytochrome c [Planctomycetota bacterium]
MRHNLVTTIVAGAMLAALFFSVGCQNTLLTKDDSVAMAPTTQPTGEELVVAEHLKGGAQMWAENCMRCHNLRHPRERSDREWDLIVHQMRVRGNLTEIEHREILKFLQAAN